MQDRVPHEASRERRVRLPKSDDGERREGARYPVLLDLRYQIHKGRQQPETGSGRTLDMSSSGLRFIADRPLAPGVKVDLAIHWPRTLEGGPQLQLVASGKVVRVNGNEAALQIQRHEFRTRAVSRKAT